MFPPIRLHCFLTVTILTVQKAVPVIHLFLVWPSSPEAWPVTVWA